MFSWGIWQSVIFPKASKQEVEKTFGYDFNLGCLKREQTLRRFDALGNALHDMSCSTCEINTGVMRCQSGWRHEPGNYKACPNEAVTSLKSEQVAFRHEGDMAGDSTFVPSSGNWGYSRNRKFSQLLVLSLYNKKLRELWNVLKNKLRTQKSAEAGCLKHLSLLFFFLPVYRHTLLLRCYFAGDEQWLVSFKHDAWNWGSSDQRILFFTVWWSFRCFFLCKLKVCFHVSSLRKGLSFATSP